MVNGHKPCCWAEDYRGQQHTKSVVNPWESNLISVWPVQNMLLETVTLLNQRIRAHMHIKREKMCYAEGNKDKLQSSDYNIYYILQQYSQHKRLLEAPWDHMWGSLMSLLHWKCKEIINAESDIMAEKRFFIKYWRNVPNVDTYVKRTKKNYRNL